MKYMTVCINFIRADKIMGRAGKVSSSSLLCTSTAGHVDLLTSTHASVMSGSIKNVIQLLFGEDDSKSEKEAILAASILNSRKCWDIEVGGSLRTG